MGQSVCIWLTQYINNSCFPQALSLSVQTESDFEGQNLERAKQQPAFLERISKPSVNAL